ncbi:hypothetical protein C0Q70_04800 [Pomacea canaliculata]|uniref:Uncharacterized protein n=1 Tax=Pomacea canaliculata TaxID=400727 RepID=A0A2T7PJD3_POMCA|nr:hypothetical protein C0Q70_04800 [Pomacea canaliculata]
MERIPLGKCIHEVNERERREDEWREREGVTELFSNCRAAAAADFRDLGFNCVVKEPHQEVVRSGFMFVGP